MDVDKILPMVDGEVKLEVMENKENNDGNLRVDREFQCPNNCWGWEKKCKQAEERYGVLMSMFEKKVSEFESLEGKHSALQLEKLVIDDEVQCLRKRNEEFEGKISCTLAGKGVEGVVDLTEDVADDKVMELMIENKVLDCEKKKAESEVEVWKAKCKELESRVLELEQRLTSGGGECTLIGTTKVGLTSPGAGAGEISGAQGFQGGVNDAATPSSVVMFCANLTHVEEGKRGFPFKHDVKSGSRSRKQLVFGDEVSPSKRIAPATPSGVRPASRNIIDISDSEAEEKAANLSNLDLQASKMACISTDHGGGMTLDKKLFPSEKNLTGAIGQSDDDDPCRNGVGPSVSTYKRKRAANIVNSDTESDGDDHFPISRLRTNSRIATASSDKQGEPVVRRRLVRLGNLKEKSTSKNSLRCNSKRIHTECLCGIPADRISSDDEEEKNELDSEDDGFIVHDHESEGDSASLDSNDDENSYSDGELSGESDDASHGSIDYEAIIARIGRRKDHKVKWEFEADMLAAFGKDAHLCMMAVCALYRQQTTDEKFHKATIVRNARGFSQCDAYRYIMSNSTISCNAKFSHANMHMFCV